MPEVNRRQALVIEGAEVLPTSAARLRGCAWKVENGGRHCTLFLFPGVPAELDGLMASALEPWLAARAGGVARETAVLKIAGLPESVVEERIAPAYDEFGREAITILASAGEIRLQATAAGPEPERRARLQAMVERLSELAGDAVFTTREEDTLESVVGDLLRAAGATLTAAESCTGGLFSQRITAVPGSSDYFLGAAVTYSNELKTQMVGVPPELLAEHGAVSEPVARAMAEGVRRELGRRLGCGHHRRRRPGRRQRGEAGGHRPRRRGGTDAARSNTASSACRATATGYAGSRPRSRWRCCAGACWPLVQTRRRR